MKFKEAEAKAKLGKMVRVRQPILHYTGDTLPVGMMGQVVEVMSVDPEGTGDEFKGKPYGAPYTLVVRFDIEGDNLGYFDKKDYRHFLEEIQLGQL